MYVRGEVRRLLLGVVVLFSLGYFFLFHSSSEVDNPILMSPEGWHLGEPSPGEPQNSPPSLRRPSHVTSPTKTPTPTVERVPRSEFLALQPELFPDTPQSFGVGCTITESTLLKDDYNYSLPLSNGCPSYDETARLVEVGHGTKEVEVTCLTRPTYTYDAQDLYGPITFPLNKVAPRKIHEAENWSNVTLTARIEWPADRDYIEIQCGSIMKYFARFVEREDVRARLKKNERTFKKSGERPPKRPNIFVLVVDSIAINQANHLFPQTHEYLKSINNGDSHRFFSFNRYNPNDPAHTITALTPVFSGVLWPRQHWVPFTEQLIYTMDYDTLKTKGPSQPLFLWDHLREKLNYVTGFGALYNSLFAARYWNNTFDHNVPAISSFPGSGTAADSNAFMYHYKPHLGPCFGGQWTFEHQFQHMSKFFSPDVYTGAPKFAYVHIMEAHRPGLDAMKTADAPLRDFLRYLTSLNDTIVVFMSDHGPYGIFARRLPFLRMIVPSDFLTAELERSLFANQGRLFSSFDLYETLKHFAIGPEYLGPDLEQAKNITERYFGPSPTPAPTQSLFWPLPLRTCQEMGILLDPDFCICSKWKKLPTTDATVIAVAERALALENENLIPFKLKNTSRPASLNDSGSFCQNLTLKSIETASALGVASYTISLTINEGFRAPAEFSVEITFEKDLKSPVTSLHFYQLTTFSVYNSCRPPGAPSHTCICDPLPS